MARIKPQQPGLAPAGQAQAQALPSTPGGLPAVGSEGRLSDDGRFRRGSSCEPGDVPGWASRGARRGDWVIIRGTNKTTDPDLLGLEAWVARVDQNGWVEVHVPKLGRNVKLQQRYLQPLPPPTPPTLGPGQCPGPGSAPAGLPPPGGRRPPSEAGAPVAGGMGQPAGPGSAYGVDDLGRPLKRPHMDPAVRPALALEALPPARVANTPSRSSSSRVRELIRAIRRDLLALEESVPWNCVAPGWKNVRPGWRRSLQRSVDSPAPTPGGALSPQPPTPSATTAAAAATAGGAAGTGAFGGGDSAAAAAAVAALVGATAASMLEFHDVLTTEKGYGLFARRGAWETRLRELADGGNNHHCLQVLWAEMAEGIRVWLAAPSPPDRAAAPPPYRSFDGGEPYGGQTPRDPFAAPRLPDDDYYQPPPGVANGQLMASPFCDFAAAGGPPGSARGGGRGGSGAPPITPWVVRSELTLLMQSIEDEVDTDVDDGPDATDVEEDSDGEAAQWARRRRQRRAEQPQPAPPAEEAKAAPVPKAAPQDAKAGGTPDAAAAAVGVANAMEVDPSPQPPPGEAAAAGAEAVASQAAPCATTGANTPAGASRHAGGGDGGGAAAAAAAAAPMECSDVDGGSTQERSREGVAGQAAGEMRDGGAGSEPAAAAAGTPAGAAAEAVTPGPSADAAGATPMSS